MSIQHYQCCLDYLNGTGRGITTWNLDNEYTLPNYALLMPVSSDPLNSATLTFTCTVPQCYVASNTIERCGTIDVHGQDACIVVFNAWRTGSGIADSSIPLRYYLNDHEVGGCCISEVSTHGATQGWDLANTDCGYYDDMCENTFILQNRSDSTIQVDHFKIYRTYKMCNLANDAAGYCNDPEMCSPETSTGNDGTLDSSRVNTPCNLEEHGGLSFTQVHDISKQGSILPAGETFAWAFDFSGSLSGGNYQGKSICLFNFNDIAPNSTDTNPTRDIALVAKLNDHIINTYFLSRFEDRGLFPSHDLATSEYYNDTGANTVELVNTGYVDVKMAGTLGGIDIYRIFQTAQVTDHTPSEPSVYRPYYGTVGVEFTVSAVSYDNESDSLTYQFNFDEVYQYSYGCASGDTIQKTCTFYSSGTKDITVKAKNPLGDWSTPGYRQMVIYPACGACEVGCQTGCEVSCQDCQTVCETSTCYNLTVIAYNYSWEEISVGVYIDEEYAGQSGSTIQVAEGGHQLYVEDPSGDCQFSYWLDIGNENPRDISVDDDVEFYAVYYCP